METKKTTKKVAKTTAKVAKPTVKKTKAADKPKAKDVKASPKEEKDLQVSPQADSKKKAPDLALDNQEDNLTDLNLDNTDENLKISFDAVDFSGKYIATVGRRKTAIAQVRLYPEGKGAIMINGQKASLYFPGEHFSLLTQPLKATGKSRDFNFSIIVNGGGKIAQASAARHGIARALLEFDAELKEALKIHGFLTRDRRRKERKKPGLKGARKRPQWSKR